MLLNGELVEIERHGIEAIDILFLKKIGQGILRIVIVPHSP